MIRAPLPADLTPLAAGLGLVPLYGDIHNHSDLSYGHGRFADALARAALQLDFVSVTGHAHWPDMPVDDPRVAHIVDFHVKGFARLRAGWEAHFDALRAADRPGLIVFPGYEIHSGADGDYTIVYADLDTSPLQLADDPAALKAALQAAKGDRALAFPHHIGYRRGARGINWSTFDGDLSPFVEILSMHGCAEASEVDRGYLHSMGPADGHGTMAYGLARGHVFGVVGNTDHHSAFPGSYGHGRTAVYAAGRDRESLWQALRARRTNALTGDNIHLLAAVGDTVQGGVFAPGNTVLRVEAVAGGFIDCIDVIRNGRLWQRISPALAPAPIARADETLIHLELGWGARRSRHHWLGEIRVEGGTIRAVEPRWRGAEVVSPLEGEDAAAPAPLPLLETAGDAIRFAAMAEANPNNFTSATQGLLLRVALDDDAVIHADLDGQQVDIPAARLFEGAKSGNLGPIDSPAWRFHALPRPEDWQWAGRIPLGQVAAGETLYLRLRQMGGQMAWTSPLFCGDEHGA